MKFFNAIIISSAIVLSSACASANPHNQGEEHLKHHPAVTADAATHSESTKTSSSMPMMVDMQDHMKKMQDTMQKIHAATTEADRKKLMTEHMSQMQDHMKMMKEMSANSGKDGMGNMADMKGMSDMKDKAGKENAMGMADGGMKCGMMEKMDMMQSMMEQMMQHMKVME